MSSEELSHPRLLAGAPGVAAALAASGIGVWTWTVGADVIEWSAELCRLFGLSPAAAPPTLDQYLALIHEDDRDEVAAVVCGALARAAELRAPGSYIIEHRISLPGGGVRWIEGRGSVAVDEAGRPIRMQGTAMDSTRRREAEDALRRREVQLRLFSALASDCVYAADLAAPTLVPSIVAGSFERMMKMTVEELAARGGWLEMVHPDDRAAFLASTPTVFAGKPIAIEYRVVDGAGQTRWVRDQVQPLVDPVSGKVTRIMGGVQDVTERKRLEEQLMAARKLEALARFSGEIAHDFNNLLSVVRGSVDLAESTDLPARARDAHGTIRAAVQRAGELTRGMLLFARRHVGAPQVIAVDDVLSAALPMLERAAGARVQVTLTLDREPLYVRIDPGQAQLALLNLVVNARDAMPNGGAIVVTARAVFWDKPHPERPAELAPGAYVGVEVRDDGTGMTDEVVARLFEPFFTTKAPGEGTGLGLAACHGIVKQAGGAIRVRTTWGAGSAFTLWLPRRGVDAAGKETPERSGGPRRTTESIAVVARDVGLRRALVHALRACGYPVVARTPDDSASLGDVDLLIADAPLTHVTSKRVLWIAETTATPPGDPVIGTPFTAGDVVRRVREVLDGPP